jgi:hypothetical protein
VTDTPVATLKLVVLEATSESVAAAVRNELAGLAGENELREVGGSAFVAHTPLRTADLRDRVQLLLASGESAIVVEFEAWSGYGPRIDSVWLMRRGH